MTTEQLLRKRFKVIADFPNNPFKIGDIIQMTHKEDIGMGEMEWASDFIGDEERGPERYGEREFTTYPHLFKELQWWEDRKPGEFPDYIKLKPEHGKRVYKVADSNEVYSDGLEYDYPTTEHHVKFSRCLPATEQEYLSFKTQP